ncbi:hypothetical protein ACFVFI_29000, partial [Streptomyces sp. NPDC057705]
MRSAKTAMSAMTLCAAAVLLTGCGSDAPKPAVDGGKPAAASPAPASSAPAAGGGENGGATKKKGMGEGGEREKE